MKRDRSDSGDKPKPRAAAGRKRTVPAKAQSKDGGKGGDTRKDDHKKKAVAPPRAARAAKPRPPAAKPTPPAAKPTPPAAKPAAAKPAAAKPPAASARAAKPAASAPRVKKAAPAASTKPARPPRPAAAPKAPKAATPAKAAPRAPRASRTAPTAAPSRKAEADFTDEERIESAKYATGDRPPRVFEEERFIFPETYGHNRVRLLVKDPQWLFAHWDVDPAVFSGLRTEMGERAAALSRLTLKVEDPEHGGGAVIHLPEDARSWYVRADRVRRAYRAELGLTLPSGEYRPLATSNTVRTPAGSASPRRASGRARYEGPRRPTPVEPAAEWARAEVIDPAASVAATGSAKRGSAAPGPWQPRLVESRPGHVPGEEAYGDAPEKGGASDAHGPLKPGASDLHRR